MQKKFLTNLGLLLFLNLLIKPFWILGIDRTVYNVVGAEDYGFYITIFNFSFLFNILLDFGITNFNNRNIAQHNHLLNKHFSSIIVLKIVLAVVYLFVSFFIGLIIGYDLTQLKFLGVLAFNQFLISLILYLRSNISGLLLFKTESFLSVLDRLLMIIICGVLLWGNVMKTSFKIEWFIYAQTSAYLITALIAFSIVIRKAAFRRLKWNWPFFVMIIKQSFPFAVLVLLMTFYNRIDSVLIERLLPDPLGEEQAGIYFSAYRLLDGVNMFAFLFAVLLLPIFSKMIKIKQNVEELVKLAFTLLITFSVIVAVGSYFYDYELMELLYIDHIKESAAVFKYLMSGFVAISITYVFGTLLTANGNLKELNIVAASGMVISFVLNWVLIPRLLAPGSAYASISSQFVTAIIQVILVQRVFRFRVNYRFLMILALYIGGVILINVLSKNTGFDWEVNFVIMIIASFLLAFSLRLLHVKSLLKILREG